MRFTVIGHAGLFVEAEGTSLLVDPWLVGSCYWRSWWLDPPIDGLDPAWLEPDVVYLTHHHFDHFHYPSMRRLDRSAQVLVPRFGVEVMADELRDLGFRDVREVRHGEVVELAPGFRLASYQYGFDDTVPVIAHGDDVLADLNDCKIRGRPRQQILDDFGQPTFMLKTHSWAQAYPNCYEAEDPADLGLVRPETFIADFLDAARHLRPRYAVPFANMVAFLHPETARLNDSLITPTQVAEAFAASPVEGTELVTMGPGDSWSSSDGFDGTGADPFVDRAARVERRSAEVAPRIAEQEALEAATPLTWDAFQAYFSRFVRDVPWPVRRFLLRRATAFEVASPGGATEFWTVDARHRSVERSGDVPDGVASITRLDDGLLADAIEKRLVHLLHISMRIRVRLRRGGTGSDLGFWGVVAMWELGYLPVRRVLSLRFAGASGRRWREILDAIRALTRGRGSPIDRLSGGFATPQDEVAPTATRP